MPEPIRLKFEPSKRRVPIIIDIDGEEFHMSPISGMRFVEWTSIALAQDPAGDPDDPEVKRAKLHRQAEEGLALVECFRESMEEAEWERFRKFCHGPKGPDVLGLVEIIEKVTEASAGFPTQPPKGSPSGQEATGTGSTDDAPSPDST